MSYGLQPKQMDEWRDKHLFRCFFEDRVLELRDISLHIWSSVTGFSDLISKILMKVSNNVDKNFIINALLIILISIVIIF
jgi:hypothetical protein